MQLGTASAQWAFQPTGYSHPLNDACAGASALSGISQDTTFASTAASDPTPSCGAGDRSVRFLVQAGDSKLASLDTTGSDDGTIVSVWPMAQPCGALTTQLACGAGSATWSAEAGQTYRVQITRGSGGGGSLAAVVSVPEPGAGAAGAACLALLALARRRARTDASRRRGRRRLAARAGTLASLPRLPRFRPFLAGVGDRPMDPLLLSRLQFALGFPVYAIALALALLLLGPWPI